MDSTLLKPPTQFNKSDISSLANIDSVVCTHHDINLTIEFDNKRLSGSITYHLQVLQSISEVDLDVRNIHVSRAVLNNVELQFKVVQYEKITRTLGDQLKIHLASPLEAGQNIQLTVEFHTLESKESALNWLLPSQTQGKQHPYLFTQCEPIWNRTIFPCQDTPAIKSTFTANLTVPKAFKAYASGRLVGQKETSETNVMTFQQDIPIPSYLFAVVSGNLVEKKISDRTSVIAEPEVIDKCVQELEDMEVQLKALEDFITPYDWKEYKVVVLPPSFPYGGMENPLLTFVSPSIIVGDKSSTDVIIHEMAHSWSGNLFSCKNWNSFWLNEGWTVYFECEIVRRLHGEEAYKTKFTLKNNDLINEIDGIGLDHSYTTLNPQIGYENPDDAFSYVPYVRGAQLLTHIQDLVGTEAFQKFTKSFVNTYKFKSLDTAEFLQFFKDHFGKEVYEKIDWESWINKVGYPPHPFNLKSESVSKTKQAAQEFLDNNTVCKKTWDSFTVQQKIIFLQEINNKDQLTLEKVQLLEKTLELNTVLNPEIYTKWFVAALSVKHAQIVPLVQKHLSQHGRMKFVRDIYKSLYQYDPKIAVDTFLANQSLYYGITYTLTKADLQI
ncbi:hypothetical protein ABPG72_020636 [Tetrahymena utriculariae]